jgi:hypothetical protein
MGCLSWRVAGGCIEHTGCTAIRAWLSSVAWDSTGRFQVAKAATCHGVEVTSRKVR